MSSSRWFVFVLLSVAVFAFVESTVSNSGYCHAEEASWRVGASKLDITPVVPIRLSGYSARPKPAMKVADPLFVRAMIMFPPSSGENNVEPFVVVSLDAIGVSAIMTETIYQRITEQMKIPRERFVICTTHSHTAPHLDGVLTNMFAEPMSEPELAAMKSYTQLVADKSVEVVLEASRKVAPCKVEYGLGRAEFAINRRVVQDKKWTGFGTVDDGPVDRNVRVIVAKDLQKKTVGVLYQYACHCTSISPEVNEVSGDWAGMSSTAIERQHEGCVALPIIGCGADANPNPRGTYDNAVSHGKSMAQSVNSVLSGPLKSLPSNTHAAFTLVALPHERPSRQKLEEMVNSKSPHERSFALSMLDVLKRKDRITESYPAPVHFWNFGSELAWVFMGGEVVVDYQIRFERELSQFANVWVAGYTDDVFAYVASERVRGEGGYEVDSSMLYYNQPGRWASGTEDAIVARTLELAKRDRPADKPLSPQESLRCIQLPKGWKVELVATEPLVVDPINVAFGADGTVWVVEMGDYPQGGSHTGCIKTLRDTDGDGKLDTAKVFADNLNFPAGVYPWRDGVVIACAPSVFFLRDSDGDGIGDERTDLLNGFPEGNPQHRVHGFTYGLDHRLYFGPGGGANQITVTKQGIRNKNSEQKVASKDEEQIEWVAGYDIALDVDNGNMERVSGVTQYIRTCDDYGNWFGNENSLPFFHYVIDSRWLEHSDARPTRRYQLMTTPPTSPPVFPISRGLDRFNDLYSANRFTSACSAIVARVPGVGDEFRGMGLVCEPVHNLVARFELIGDGATWKAQRFAEDSASDWVRSSDPWFRPVRVENAPDGSIWIVDMYRYVIEHPEWIPEEWQRRMNVRAGDDMGRIYRVAREDYTFQPIRDWTKASDDDLVKALSGDNSRIADIAQQQLIWRNQDGNLANTTIEALRQLFRREVIAYRRLRIFATLRSLDAVTTREWELALGDSEPRVVRQVVNWLGKSTTKELLVHWRLDLIKEETWRQSAALALDLLMLASVDRSDGENISPSELANLLKAFPNDRWIVDATALLHPNAVDNVVRELLSDHVSRTNPQSFAELPVLEKLMPRTSAPLREELIKQLATTKSSRPAWHYMLAREFAVEDTSNSKSSSNLLAQLAQDGIREVQNEMSLENARIAAVSFLTEQMRGGNQIQLNGFRSTLKECKNDRVCTSIVRSLIDLGPQVASELIIDWNSWSSATRTAAIQSLASRQDLVGLLLQSVREKRTAQNDVDASTIARLRSYSDIDVSRTVIDLFGSPPGADRVQVIQEAASHWPAKTDLVRGKEMYTKHCAVCHDPRTIDGAVLEGIGPNLSVLSSWNNEAWLTAILDPNRTVDEKYRSIQIRLDDGTILTGLMTRENQDTLEWIASDGRTNVTRKTAIEEMKSTTNSMMPEGLEKLLSPQQLADVISYMRSMR